MFDKSIFEIPSSSETNLKTLKFMKSNSRYAAKLFNYKILATDKERKYDLEFVDYYHSLELDGK